jgi:hypothetical protein
MRTLRFKQWLRTGLGHNYVEFEDDLGTTYRHDLTQFEELLLTMLLKINEGKED